MPHINNPYNRRPYYEEVDPEKKTKRPWQAWLSGSPVLLISILLHIALAILAALLIVQRIQQKRPPNFTEVVVQPANAAAAAANHKTQVTDKQRAMTTPEIVQTLSVNDLSSITLPDVSLPSDSSPSGNGKLQGTAVSGEGVGLSGNGVGSMGAGMEINTASIVASAFGMPDAKGRGLKGNFYDLKQLKNRTPSGVDNRKYSTVVADFISSNWRENFFKDYFVGPDPLYLPQLFIPYMSANEGPKSFNVGNLVEPRNWVIVYSGKITVEHEGDYRFVGYGDDVNVVSVDHRTVLDASLDDAMRHEFPPVQTYDYDIPVQFNSGEFAGGHAIKHFRVGSWVHMRDGDVYRMKILIGERPGGYFGAWLMVEEKGVTYPKTPLGFPILPIFKVGPAPVPGTTGCPPADKTTDLGWHIADNGDDDETTN